MPARNATRVLLLQSRHAGQDFSRFPQLLEGVNSREDCLAAVFTLIDPERADHAASLSLLLDELGWEQIVLAASRADSPLAAAIAAEIPARISGLFLIRPETPCLPDLDMPVLIVNRPDDPRPSCRSGCEIIEPPTLAPGHLSEILHAFCVMRTDKTFLPHV
ncbi:hypothetical protein OS242_16140 [Tumebacillus sp. DT12]|uniref:Uncharacterized protein n=1 Tax=Tumebacillus lacus TaxID=2995335 RepID=A0ABT3X3L2_9BACL|nr:hypothetical protein [Tumebacillus lacus]MCX7571479.1 hypothetical protein [Tumebacillus lacus]